MKAKLGDRVVVHPSMSFNDWEGPSGVDAYRCYGRIGYVISINVVYDDIPVYVTVLVPQAQEPWCEDDIFAMDSEDVERLEDQTEGTIIVLEAISVVELRCPITAKHFGLDEHTRPVPPGK